MIGNAHVFTLKDGSTLRIFSRETKEIKKSLVSKELEIAQDMGLISLIPKDVVEKKRPKKKRQEVLSNG